jgi:hypothetical protein
VFHSADISYLVVVVVVVVVVAVKMVKILHSPPQKGRFIVLASY